MNRHRSFFAAAAGLLMTATVTSAWANVEAVALADKGLDIVIPNPPMSTTTGAPFRLRINATCADQTNLRSIPRPLAKDGCALLKTEITLKDGTKRTINIKAPGAMWFPMSAEQFAATRNAQCPEPAFDWGSDPPKPWTIVSSRNMATESGNTQVMLEATTDLAMAAAVLSPNGDIQIENRPVKLKKFGVYQFGTNRGHEVTDEKGNKSIKGEGYTGHDDPNQELTTVFESVQSLSTGLITLNIRLFGAADIGQTWGLTQSGAGDCTSNFSPLMLFFDERRPLFSGTSRYPLAGLPMTITWPEANSPGYFLAVDRDGDGKIATADELFGTGSLGKYPNGFERLKLFDSDKNGVVDHRDKEFHRLVLWQDRNGDGVSQATELKTLEEMQVLSLNLKYKRDKFIPTDTAQYREYSSFAFRGQNGKLSTGTIIDVWFTNTNGTVAGNY